MPQVLTGPDCSRLPKLLTDRIAVEGECWVWTGARHPAGHGIVYLGNGVWEYTHRVAYAVAHDGIPAGRVVHHECENKPCCRPDHLRAVTPKEHAAEHGPAGAAATHAAKSACPRGHPYDLVVRARGRSPFRDCSICRRERQRAHEAKRKAARC